MAIRNDFQCTAGHIEERTVRSGQRHVRCHCGKRAEVVYLSRASRRARQAITPTVYYENAEGQVWSGPDAVTPCPLPGYQRFEVQPHEIRAFERKQNARMQKDHYDQLERHGEAAAFHSAHREQVRRELDAEILAESAHWDTEHREILHHAMEHRDEPTFTRNYDPEFHVNSYS